MYWTLGAVTCCVPSFVSTQLFHKVAIPAVQQELCSVHQDLFVYQLCHLRYTLLGPGTSPLILRTGYCKMC